MDNNLWIALPWRMRGLGTVNFCEAVWLIALVCLKLHDVSSLVYGRKPLRQKNADCKCSGLDRAQNLLKCYSGYAILLFMYSTVIPYPISNLFMQDVYPTIPKCSDLRYRMPPQCYAIPLKMHPIYDKTEPPMP